MQLKEIRVAMGLSQSKVARDLNLTQATYNRYENGQRQIPNAILLSMADYFGVTSDELLGRPGAQNDNNDEDEVMALREQLRRDPNTRTLFDAARKAKPEHIKAALAVLKSFEEEDE